MKTKLTSLLAAAAMVVGFNAASIEDAAAYSEYCDQQARHYANEIKGRQSGQRAVAGALIGALGGAAIGSAESSRRAGKGALIGGGAGALVGALSGSAGWRRNYEHAYHECVSNARYNKPKYTQPRHNHSHARYNTRPQPWTEEWYQYCSAKYRSFDPDSGTFQPYNGPRKLCR